MTPTWNRFIYRLWAPVYDAALGRLFAPGRARAAALLDARAGERVLLPGAGTGADLPLLAAGVTAVALDFSPAMLARAAGRAGSVPANVLLVLGDAERLPFGDGTFDAALLGLVLSVVPDGAACWREAARAVRPGGRIVVFDKFAPEGRAPSRGRRLLNAITRAGGTDITRRFSDLAAGTAFTVEHDEPGILRGAYRVLRVRLS